jgi:hypothetical protein
VKVQNTGVANASAFDSLFFYYGTDGGAWSGMTGGDAQVSIPPASTLRLTVSVVGSDVTAMIDTNFDGTPELTYIRGGLPTENLGTKVGVGLLLLDTAVWADNFSATDVPEPSSFVALGAAGMLLMQRRAGLRR